MKKALFRYDAVDGQYKNMGDYIQSIAAKQFIGNDFILLERDHLNEYAGEQVKVIMAAWWMHYPDNWPPSENITPLFISFHITPAAANGILNEKGVQYLKKYEPIGCRDIGTQRLLESKGIKAYFSGCLTLTLGKTYKKSEDEKIIFVEPFFKKPDFKKPWTFIKPIHTIFTDFNSVKKISLKKYSSTSVKSLIKSAAFLNIYKKLFEKNIIVNAYYYTHSAYEPSFKNEKEKFDYADNLLRNYTFGKFLVTSRLHAALPSVAMGVPTIFVYDDNIPRSSGRFEGLLNHVHQIEYKNSQWISIGDFEIPEIIDDDFEFSNKNSHLELVKEMSRKCEVFLSNNN